jgi:hypothetical protein
VFVSSPDGVVRIVQPGRLQRLLGYAEGEIQGKNIAFISRTANARPSIWPAPPRVARDPGAARASGGPSIPVSLTGIAAGQR